jgi:hypothetical protein
LIFCLLDASPLSSSKTTDARTVLNLYKTDCRTLIVTFWMKILGSPPMLSGIKNHFHRNKLRAQLFNDKVDEVFFFPNERRRFKMIFLNLYLVNISRYLICLQWNMLFTSFAFFQLFYLLESLISFNSY